VNGFLQSQMEIYMLSSPSQRISVSAYIDLVKSSWILIDLIACHPQVPFISASTSAEIHSLSSVRLFGDLCLGKVGSCDFTDVLEQAIKDEYRRIESLGLIVPDINSLDDGNLEIWEPQLKGPSLILRRNMGAPHNMLNGLWAAEGGEEVIFQRHGFYRYSLLRWD